MMQVLGLIRDVNKIVLNGFNHALFVPTELRAC